MRILLNWGSCGGNGPQVPSPIPPWNRPRGSSTPLSLNGDGQISLNVDTTYLDSLVPKDPANLDTPYAIVLPNGNGPRQIIRIYIPQPNIVDTAKFEVSGTFAGFSKLDFDDVGFSAVLEWDGFAWFLIGGNARPIV